MNSVRQRAVVGLVVAGLLILSRLAEHYGTKAERLNSVSAFSRTALGTSVFHQWLTETKAAPAKLAQHALLRDSDLGPEAYAILSPRSPISSREAKQIRSFVEKGGKLILSAHDEATRGNLKQLATLLKVPLAEQEAPDFKNGSAVTVTPEKDDLLFRKGEAIAFYSPYQFGGPACALNALACYREIHGRGKGTVLVLTGLPYFSNALIGRAQNSAAALRLAQWGKGLAFDEYHHFFSDRTWVDLVGNLAFSLPLAGMLLLLVLFFRFGHTRFHHRRGETETVPANSMHDWNEGIVTASLTRFSLGEAVDYHRRSLQSIFKRGVAEPLPPQSSRESRQMLLKNAGELLRSHQNFLLRKRKVLK